MIIDARNIPKNYTLKTEVCIIGAGAAGISLSREFIGQPFRVSILESGDLEHNEDTQSLYQGDNTGLPYYPLNTARLRYFGGSTNHWGGYCLPFDDFDFESREWIPYSGWPIRRADLEPYYDRARSICQLESSEWSPTHWLKRDIFSSLPFMGDRVYTGVMQLIQGDLGNFGKAYHQELSRAENVTTYLNANAIDIETDETGKTVKRIRVACLSGNKFSITSKQFILAAGGIENPRLLLLSNNIQTAGLGNQNDLVGRFFMDHPRFLAGVINPSSPDVDSGFYEIHKVNNSTIRGYLRLSREVQRKERLAGVHLKLQPVQDESYTKAIGSSDLASFHHLVGKLRREEKPEYFGKHLSIVMADLMSWKKLWINFPLLPNSAAMARILHSKQSNLASIVFDYLGDIAVYLTYRKILKYIPISHIDLIARIDPAPNPDSRITLSGEKDRLGQKLVKLDWRLSPIDKHSLRRALEIIAVELGRAGLGRLQIRIDDDDTTWPPDLEGAWHHIGTTRMSDDPKKGVVDKNCRVHGISNLYIAGSSVFPTSGSGTPTLTLVALALRLADHVKMVLK